MEKTFSKDHHYHLKKGDTDPELNKIIDEIVLCSEKFIVYVASDLSVQWRTTDEHEWPEHCGEVLNIVASLISQSSFISNALALHNIRYEIAEGLARCLDGHSKENSLAALNEVEIKIKARNRETSWKWYFTTSYIVTILCVILFILLWLQRDWVRILIGANAFEIMLGTICGTLGALLSVTSRGDRLVMDANAGKHIHQLEGLSRIGAGLIGAFFVALAIKSGLILGGIQFTGSKLSLLLTLCLVAGASERLVPSLVERFEKVALSNKERP